ncbi:MAG TPA: hypothetical protein ACHBZ9_21785 [Arsenophonus nasoniae]|uniref:hypothetical protein n=1 Tax=Arsenophonus nasoniae TaxID=638 RepID=UPI003879F515
MKIKTLIIFILIISRNAYADYTYTCSSDFTHEIKLNSNSDLYPISGTKYEVPFNSNNNYVSTCDVPEDGRKSETYFKATYSNNYNVDNKGYMILNDFVKVKAYIYIYNKDYVSVPFTDVSNNVNRSLAKKQNFTSGSKGKVEIIIRKSILNGNINIPEFYVNLYSRNKFANDFRDKYLARVHFNTSTLNVKKICDVKNRSFEKVIQNVTIQDAIGHTKMFDGFDVEIACEEDVSDLNLKLAFIGKRFSHNADFFASDKKASFGVGLWNKKENKFINESSPYSVKIINKKETIPFSVVPYLVKSEDYFDSNNIEFSLSTYLYSDE